MQGVTRLIIVPPLPEEQYRLFITLDSVIIPPELIECNSTEEPGNRVLRIEGEGVFI